MANAPRKKDEEYIPLGRNPRTLLSTCQRPTGVLPVAPVETWTNSQDSATDDLEENLPRLVDLDVAVRASVAS